MTPPTVSTLRVYLDKGRSSPVLPSRSSLVSSGQEVDTNPWVKELETPLLFVAVTPATTLLLTGQVTPRTAPLSHPPLRRRSDTGDGVGP